MCWNLGGILQHQFATFRKLIFASGEENRDPWHCLLCCSWPSVLPHGAAQSGGEEARAHLAAVFQPHWGFSPSTAWSSTRRAREPHVAHRLHFRHPAWWLVLKGNVSRAILSCAWEHTVKSETHFSSRCNAAAAAAGMVDAALGGWRNPTGILPGSSLADLNCGSPSGAGEWAEHIWVGKADCSSSATWRSWAAGRRTP